MMFSSFLSELRWWRCGADFFTLQFATAKLTSVFALVARLAEHFKPTAR
ncbi:hypothetical protein GCFR_04699 [Citrobacter freundii ATCC 8090 = MTCC 1658 = NBRC 12681]|nr:hypothetical protein [Citrobacter freundii]ELO3996615.1 hypothetical protein [Citrobacter freundii]EXF28121.1 hypothetical protein V172_23515 [Citrobacter freundii RLS1]KFB90657.1 hypothetical protein GCFR_04699 [Citrobacter freundii ATCC 8090 = MTCC 1658 = NBRC 12681]MDT7355672.1 hypothetical protein [Citrobacter freundii]MDU1435662.1 hypothetical protein [Citrobacter freundii]